ncbi:hypothetical protein B6U74_06710 [Candidatus Bathyarchaeota archaeon ex4484_205]|nr:MAG: hypothetical protein B6U74_06710 [Candidatus Bathyarchaeota archaeon ex4484_205]RLF90046.1 MAG: hypothetical protein DRN46_04440 [Thermococci archaeon]RLF96769.1 MAG: hypothetical protein DRN52_01825 [Thermococci archaeon]
MRLLFDKAHGEVYDFYQDNPLLSLSEFHRIASDLGLRIWRNMGQLKNLLKFDILFMLLPKYEFSEKEIEEMKNFVLDGGLLVVAGGLSKVVNSLTSDFGLTLNGDVLVDPLRNYGEHWLPLVETTEKHWATKDVKTIVPLCGRTLNLYEGSKVLARASPSSYGILGPYSQGEKPPFMGTSEDYPLIVLGDGHLFSDDLIWMGDNESLLVNLLRRV